MRRNEASQSGRGRRLLGPDVTWSDARLIRACLKGSEDAWATLIAKYKNLIYSIPMKYGASPEDAADIFQAVCLELFAELPRLRKPDSIPQLADHGCGASGLSLEAKDPAPRRRRADEREAETLADRPAAGSDRAGRAGTDASRGRGGPSRALPGDDQAALLSPAPVSYQDVAARLGLATGSIGFIRGRCLKRLQRTLEKRGF